MKVRHAEPEIASQQLLSDLIENRGSGTIDRRNRLRIYNEPPRRLRKAIDNPPDPISHIVDIEKDQAALHEIDGKTGNRFGTRFAMQLVEAVAPGDAAQQGIARARYAG